ncbi:unnamed protein product [Coregonus sp. 'balchen']|nr:unnamed protein product [Coregonus sp. 'balchen']
MLSAGPTGC